MVVSPDVKMQTRIGKYVSNVNPEISMVFADGDMDASSLLMSSRAEVIVYEQAPNMDAFRFYDMASRHGGCIPMILISPDKDADLAIAAMDARMDYYLPESTPNFFMELASRIVMSAERGRSVASRHVNTNRSSAILDLLQMKDRPLEEVLKYALEEAVKLTDSAIGYIALYNSQERRLKMVSWSLSVMNSCTMSVRPIYYDLDKTGVWGEPIRQMKSVVINDYINDAEYPKSGTPAGHVKLSRLLMVPIIMNGVPVATVGVGNKVDEYTSQDEEQLRLFILGFFSIHGDNLFREDKDAADSRLSEFIQYIPMGIVLLNRDLRFTHANFAARSYLGLDESSVINKGFDSLQGEGVEAVRRSLHLAKADGSPKVAYFRYRGGETPVDVYASVVPIFKEKEINGWLVAMNDLSFIYRTAEGYRPVRERIRSIMSHSGHMLAAASDKITDVMPRTDEEGRSKLRSAQDSMSEMIAYFKTSSAIGSYLPVWMDLRECVGKPPDGVSLEQDVDDVQILADRTFPVLFSSLYGYSLRLGASLVSVRTEFESDGRMVICYSDDSRGVPPRLKDLIGSDYSSGFSYVMAKDIADTSGFRFSEMGKKG